MPRPAPKRPRSSVRPAQPTPSPAIEAPGASTVTFAVYGDPVPQPRPRIYRNGGVGEDPKATTHKGKTAAAARAVGARRLLEPVDLSVVYYRRTHARVDLDNLLKLTQDALTGTCWLDDSQIVSVDARKYVDSEAPRTIVTVRPAPPVVAPVTDWHRAWEGE